MANRPPRYSANLMPDAEFYRDLWEQAEASRKAADDHVRQTAAIVLELLALLGADDHPEPEVRGKVRMLRTRVTHHTTDR